MTVYGYCRVSTPRQSMDRQIQNIRAVYPEALIVTDEYTGTTLLRPGWIKLYKKLAPGDTVVFDQASRMSRDADEGFRVYQELFDRGVRMVFLRDHYIDSDMYATKLKQADISTGKSYLDEGLKVILMGLAKEQIRVAFERAEDEARDTRRKTSEGIRVKMRRNEELIFSTGSEEEAKKHPDWRQIGQQRGAKLTTKKSLAAKEVIRRHSRAFGGGLWDSEVMKLAEISRMTYYKYKKELRQEQASEG